jgi:Protein of unknown function (DUF3035)
VQTRTIVVQMAYGAMALSALALSACSGGGVQHALGMGKQAPDEFAVVSRAPLIIPPDFDLRPPEPGASRPMVGTTEDQARATLLGQSQVQAASASDQATGSTGGEATGLTGGQATGPTGGGAALADASESAGQQTLLAKASGGAVDPNIRREIAADNDALVQVEGELFTRLMKWREPNSLGATVDAPAEAQRLMTNRAEGKPATAGDTPTVVERRQSPLGALVEKVF